MLFEITDQFHKKIRLTDERFEHVLEHPEIRHADIEKIKETILVPDNIKQSKHDPKVWVYYRFYKKTRISQKYLAVIVKILNGTGFIITAYYTDKVKEGKTIWKR